VIIPISDTVGPPLLLLEVTTAGDGVSNPMPINEAAVGVTVASAVGAPKLIPPPVMGILAIALVVAVTVSEETPSALTG
jgi:hypothetical protein